MASNIQKLCSYTALSLLFILLLSQIISLCIVCWLSLIYNCCFICFSFKSYRKKEELQNIKYNETDFHIYLYQYSLFLHIASSSTRRNPFSISCRVILWVMNSFSFILKRKESQLFPHPWKVLWNIEFLVDRFFFLHFNYVIQLTSEHHILWWEIGC